MKQSVTEKVQKEMPEFAEEVNALSVDQLNNRLAQCAKDAETIAQTQEEDQELETARATATALNAPYIDGKKAIRLKSRYIIALIKEKGGDL